MSNLILFQAWSYVEKILCRTWSYAEYFLCRKDPMSNLILCRTWSYVEPDYMSNLIQSRTWSYVEHDLMSKRSYVESDPMSNLIMYTYHGCLGFDVVIGNTSTLIRNNLGIKTFHQLTRHLGQLLVQLLNIPSANQKFRATSSTTS
jgi:hypothetical protein